MKKIFDNYLKTCFQYLLIPNIDNIFAPPNIYILPERSHFAHHCWERWKFRNIFVGFLHWLILQVPEYNSTSTMSHYVEAVKNSLLNSWARTTTNLENTLMSNWTHMETRYKLGGMSLNVNMAQRSVKPPRWKAAWYTKPRTLGTNLLLSNLSTVLRRTIRQISMSPDR